MQASATREFIGGAAGWCGSQDRDAGVVVGIDEGLQGGGLAGAGGADDAHHPVLASSGEANQALLFDAEDQRRLPDCMFDGIPRGCGRAGALAGVRAGEGVVFEVEQFAGGEPFRSTRGGGISDPHDLGAVGESINHPQDLIDRGAVTQ